MKQKFDIAAEMQRNLNLQNDGIVHINKIAEALECLSKAADLLDNLEEPRYAEAVTRVIENVAKR